MTNALAQIMKPRSRADLDREAGSIDPWSLSNAPLFNDANFLPQNSVTLSAGVTRDDVKELKWERVKQEVWRAQKPLHVVLYQFQSFRTIRPRFVSFIFSRKAPLHVPALHGARKRIPRAPVHTYDSVGSADYAPSPCTDEPDRYKSRKRSRSASASTDNNCNLRGLEDLKEVLEPVSKKLMLEAEEAEVLRSKSEAAKSQVKAISSTVKAISDPPDGFQSP
jgi:hypothetical protein